jgi:hypothetical protein
VAFFATLRRFLRWHEDFDTRLGVVERKTESQRLELSELSEFTHKLSRKRYQDDYKPIPPTIEGIASGITPPVDNSSKAALWRKARDKWGAQPPKAASE